MTTTLELEEDLIESPRTALSVESKLEDLILYDYQAEIDSLGVELKQTFTENPLLPGVILNQSGQFFGMISQRSFFELLSRRYGPELFLNRPLRVLYDYVQTLTLRLPGTTPILRAAQQSLQRSPELIYEPIVVQLSPQSYRLLDVHHLLLAQARIHELTTRLLNEQTQAKLIQTEKMASLGQMVAGVAHEILNPVNFIAGNIEYLANYGQDLLELVEIYDAELSQLPKVDDFKEEIDFEFLLKDFPQVISSIRLGTERLRKIISTLRNFSHVDEAQKRLADIHVCLDDTLLILHNRLKYEIEVVKHYGELPAVRCYSGQLSQVFMNLIVNAIDALTEVAEASPDPAWQPQIDITTEIRTKPALSGKESNWAVTCIADNGPGIPPEIQTRIFETFFTTKPVGKGTGLGLAITNQIVVEKHGGELNLHSQPGEGTTFEVWLPLD
jgi:signal transduction histidine kinase